MIDAPELMTAAGRALFGENWKAPLARALGVSKDAVQDWAQGRMRPRPGVWVDLAAVMETRQAELNAALRRVKRA